MCPAELLELEIGSRLVQSAQAEPGILSDASRLVRKFQQSPHMTHLQGAGKGRVPDAQAIARNESYALLWDAKARLPMIIRIQFAH